MKRLIIKMKTVGLGMAWSRTAGMDYLIDTRNRRHLQSAKTGGWLISNRKDEFFKEFQPYCNVTGSRVLLEGLQLPGFFGIMANI